MSMIPWQHLDSARVPGDGGELRLYQRGGEFSMRVDGYELMNSRIHASEEALSELACRRLADLRRPQVLIGGLGMGYTLAAALRRLSTESRVVVAEVAHEVVEWNRGPLGDLAGRPLQDRRVTVREVDVAQLLLQARESYDAILLDVDNGPEGLTRRDNDWLYARAGLQAAFWALRSEGVLGVWSASPDRAFSERLHRVGFDVEEVHVRSRARRRGARHTIWLASRAD
jgi:spermidine synthase